MSDIYKMERKKQRQKILERSKTPESIVMKTTMWFSISRGSKEVKPIIEVNEDESKKTTQKLNKSAFSLKKSIDTF